MVNLYAPITDTSIEAYRPVTGRLMKRYARNLDALGWITLSLPNVVSGVTSSSSYVTLFTFRLFLADRYIGEDGARLSFGASIGVDETGSGGVGAFKATIDGVDTAEQFVNALPGAGSGSDSVGFSRDWTPTGNTVIDIEFKGKATGGASSCDLTISTSGTVLASLPRSV